MITSIENFSEDSKELLNKKLEENLKMQKDCEIEMERCEEARDADGYQKTKETLEALKFDELEIRKQL